MTTRQPSEIRRHRSARLGAQRRVDHSCSPRQFCVRCSMMKVIQERFKCFRSAFGRDPLPHEPLFFAEGARSPELATPGEVKNQLLRAAQAAMVPPLALLKFLGIDHQGLSV